MRLRFNEINLKEFILTSCTKCGLIAFRFIKQPQYLYVLSLLFKQMLSLMIHADIKLAIIAEKILKCKYMLYFILYNILLNLNNIV